MEGRGKKSRTKRRRTKGGKKSRRRLRKRTTIKGGAPAEDSSAAASIEFYRRMMGAASARSSGAASEDVQDVARVVDVDAYRKLSRRDAAWARGLSDDKVRDLVRLHANYPNLYRRPGARDNHAVGWNAMTDQEIISRVIGMRFASYLGAERREQERKVAQITEMGFSPDEATRALAAKSGTVEEAVDLLVTGGLPPAQQRGEEALEAARAALDAVAELGALGHADTRAAARVRDVLSDLAAEVRASAHELSERIGER